MVFFSTYSDSKTAASPSWHFYRNPRGIFMACSWMSVNKQCEHSTEPINYTLTRRFLVHKIIHLQLGVNTHCFSAPACVTVAILSVDIYQNLAWNSIALHEGAFEMCACISYVYSLFGHFLESSNGQYTTKGFRFLHPKSKYPLMLFPRLFRGIINLTV